MLKKKPLTSFNDGVLDIYREPDTRSTFGARENPSIDEMEIVARLYYNASSIRQQDFEAFEQRGIDVTAKVCTQYLPAVDADCIVVIGARKYGIGYIDVDKRTMYLYLTGGQDIDPR